MNLKFQDELLRGGWIIVVYVKEKWTQSIIVLNVY